MYVRHPCDAHHRVTPKENGLSARSIFTLCFLQRRGADRGMRSSGMTVRGSHLLLVQEMLDLNGGNFRG